MLWDIRNEIVADIRADRDTVINKEKTVLCVDADGQVVDGEHITIIFRTESVFEQQVLRFAFAYGSWAVGFADSIDINDEEIVGCRLEDGFVEIPEFEEEVLISSK